MDSTGVLPRSRWPQNFRSVPTARDHSPHIDLPRIEIDQGHVMNLQKAPRSLRLEAAVYSLGQTVENNSGKKVSAVAGLIAVASFSGAEAQQSNLPPV